MEIPPQISKPVPQLGKAWIALCFLMLAAVTGAAKEPWEQLYWGVDTSAKILFHPPQQIEFREGEVRFLADEFTYVYRQGDGHWTVTPARNQTQPIEGWGTPAGGPSVVETAEGPLVIETPEPGALTLSWAACPRPLGRLQLWTREQLGRAWLKQAQRMWGPRPSSPEEVAKRITLSDVYVSDWFEDRLSLWLAIRFYMGEGSAGIGTLVEIRKPSCTVRIHQPPNLGLFSISHIVGVRDVLWLATEQFYESGTGPGVGLVRYSKSTGKAEPLGEADPTRGSYINALVRRGETLWVATVDGFCALSLPSNSWRAWRIVPRVKLTKPLPVLNLPGGRVRGRLPPGQYEVRWVGEGFVELLTPDCLRGLLDSSWYKTLEARNFNQGSMNIATSTKWGIGGLRVFSSPVPHPDTARPESWFLRVPAAATAKEQQKWQPVKVCAGWVELPSENVYLNVERVK